VCEFTKLELLSLLGSIDIVILHYIVLYFIAFGVDVV
jgi:hypothetical protein